MSTPGTLLKLAVAAAPQYVAAINRRLIYKTLTDLNNYYTRLLGLDEVREYQERVVALQEKLLGVQERRRNIGLRLGEMRRKSTELQEQIHKTKRNEELQRFLDLMREETEVLKLERDINTNFIETDREEREVFTAFTNAVRDSHEKQRAQLEYTKYFGLILSIVGSFLAFCYSSLRKQELKGFIENNLTANHKTLQQGLESSKNNKEINAVLSRIDNNYEAILQRLGEFDSNTGTKVDEGRASHSQVWVYGCAAVIGYIVLSKMFG